MAKTSGSGNSNDDWKRPVQKGGSFGSRSENARRKDTPPPRPKNPPQSKKSE